MLSLNPQIIILKVYLDSFATGHRFLDISYTVISFVSIKIEDYKKMGVYEEIFALPINHIVFILISNIYPILFALFKLLVYLLFGIIFFHLSFVSIFLFIYSLIFSIITFVGLSMIVCGLTMLFYRGAYVSMIHNSVSILSEEFYIKIIYI